MWSRGAAPRPVELGPAARAVGDVLVLRVEGSIEEAGALHQELLTVCGEGLELEMIRDLLDADEFPEVQHFGDGGRIRKVSSFGVRSLGDRQGGPALVFEPIEFLAGDSWLIYHRQPCIVHRAGSAAPEEPGTVAADALEDRVLASWLALDGSTPGDLGTLFLRELAGHYSAARRTLWNSLTSWERDFYQREDGLDPLDFVEPLAELHRLHGELRGRLDALNVPRDDADTAWFREVSVRDTAHRVDEIIDHLLRDLRNFSDSLRQAMALTQSYASLRHFRLAEEQKQQSDQMQSGLELVAALLLVPTLIAGIYGANTRLPGGGQWSGFDAMMGLMVLGSGGLYFVLRRLRQASKRTAGLHETG